MAKFGTFKFGTRKFGRQANSHGWAFRVDWDGDDAYDGNEAPWVIDFECERGRQFYINENGSGFVRQNVGMAWITVDNSDGRYDPWNTASPLYPNVEPGKFVTVQVSNDTTDGIYVFTGIITNIEALHQSKNVLITCADGWQWLKNSYITTYLLDWAYFYPIKTCLSNWPTIWGGPYEILARGNFDTTEYFWSLNAPASRLVQEISESYLGYFFLDAGGNAILTAKNYGESSSLSIGESEVLKDIVIPAPWENNKNIVTVTAYSMTVSDDTETVFSTNNSQVIEEAESFDYIINLSKPVSSLEVPVLGTDYHANSLENGNGTDLTAYVNVYITNVYGISAVINAVNNYTGGGDITGADCASASAETTSYEAELAFDNSNSTTWGSTNALPAWLMQNFGEDVVINKYTLYRNTGGAFGYAAYSPKNWTFQGSANGSDWDTLDTRTNQNIVMGAGKTTYTFSNTEAYQYYRIYITANVGPGDSYVNIHEMEMCSDDGRVYVTDFRVIGTPLLISPSTHVSDESDGSFPRQFSLDMPWLQNIALAKEIAPFLSDFLKNVGRLPRFQMESRPEKQFDIDIMDIVTLDFPSVGVDEIDYRIGYIKHKWLNANGSAVRSTFYTEPVLEWE